MTRVQVFLHNGKQALIALDQLGNALMGLLVAVLSLLPFMRKAGLWWADETISAHCWRWELHGSRRWPRLFVDALARLVGDIDHCRASYESERQGRQLPPELRPPLAKD